MILGDYERLFTDVLRGRKLPRRKKAISPPPVRASTIAPLKKRGKERRREKRRREMGGIRRDILERVRGMRRARPIRRPRPRAVPAPPVPLPAYARVHIVPGPATRPRGLRRPEGIVWIPEERPPSRLFFAPAGRFSARIVFPGIYA